MKNEVLSALPEAAKTSEEICELLARISDAANRLLNTGLTEDALVILLQHISGVKRSDIRSVLHSLPALKHYYVKKKPSKPNNPSQKAR